MTPAQKRVLIVEDAPLYSDMLMRTLSSFLVIVGAAKDGESAIELAEKLEPDAVLMDIQLPGSMNGLQAAEAIKRARPSTGIVFLSAYNERRVLESFPTELSGWAYLLKDNAEGIDTILRAIDASTSGMVMLDPSVVTGLKPRKDSPITSLSRRHQEVLELIAQGYNNAAIAEKLVLAEKSIETYINTIYQTLNLSGEPGIHARVRAAMIFYEESQNA